MSNHNDVKDAAIEFVNTGCSLFSLSKKYNVPLQKLTQYVKATYLITDIKAYSREKLNEKYAICLQEWYETEEGFNDFCSKRHISRKNFVAYMNREENTQDDELISVFSRIDTAEKAYWLGFIYADGYNSGNFCCITLGLTDFNHLKKIRRFLGTKQLIHYRPSDNCVSIHVCSKNLCKDLTKNGKIKGKKYCMKFPGLRSLPKVFTKDFIRGFLDGDGSIGKVIKREVTQSQQLARKVQKVAFRIQSMDFALAMIERVKLTAHIDIHYNVVENENMATMYELYIEGETTIRNFLDFCYKEAHVYLDRKYERYLQYILPSDLEIDQIISAKLSENILPDLSDEERHISEMIRTEG